MNKVYQQNIFGGEDEVLTRISAIVYQNEQTGYYLPYDDPYTTETDELKDALIHVHEDFREPSLDEAAFVSKAYTPKIISLTVGEYNEIAEFQNLPLYKGVTI